MKRLALAICGVLAANAVVAQDEFYDDRWYWTGIGGVALVDEDRLTDDDWPYYGISVGRFMSPNFSLEFQIDRLSFRCLE